MQIGRLIKQARTSRGMTAARLAADSGLSKGFISQIENGRANPSLDTLPRIARALGLPLAALLAGGTREDRAPQSSHGFEPALVVSRSLYRDRSGLAQLDRDLPGTHFVATLPAYTSLTCVGSADSSPEHGVLVPLQGNLTLRQGQSQLRVSPGDVAIWSAGRAYEIENVDGISASALIFIPESCVVPSLHELRRPAPLEHSTHAYNAISEGPMRLVAMRARRQADRER